MAHPERTQRMGTGFRDEGPGRASWMDTWDDVLGTDNSGEGHKRLPVPTGYRRAADPSETVSAVSSMKNDVCNEASSTPLKVTVMLVPAAPLRLTDRCV